MRHPLTISKQIKTFGALSVFLLFFISGYTLFSADEHPNIVLIIADDLGTQLGCYGDKQAKTPNIDRLAERGTLFETAWVTASSCSPSRGSIFTGLYPHQNGLTGLAHHGFSFDQRYPTIASELKASGYRTGIIGKFHLTPKDICPWDYQLTGDPAHDPELISRKRDVRTMAKMAEGFVAGNTGPFFLVMSYKDPHTPLYDQLLGLPEESLGAQGVEAFRFSGYSSPALKARVASYLNCVHRLDAGVGLLIDMMEKHALLDNTIIVFISDHGPPFPRAKLSSYENGLRIPFIISGPDILEGRKSGYPVSTIDIFPTLLALTGRDSLPNLPGVVLKDYLRGKVPADLTRPLFASFTAHQKDNVFPMRAIRQKDWLLIQNLEQTKPRPRADVDGSEIWPGKDAISIPGVNPDALYAEYLTPPPLELFDLAKDPNCFDNLASDPEHQDKAAQLNRELLQWRSDTRDFLSTED